MRASHPLLAAAAKQALAARASGASCTSRWPAAVADDELRALPPRAGGDAPGRRARGHDRRPPPRGAAARGAASEAVQLAEHALRLTPPEQRGAQRAPAHARRLPRDGGRAAARDRPARCRRSTRCRRARRASAPGCCCPRAARSRRYDDHERHLDARAGRGRRRPGLRAHVLRDDGAQHGRRGRRADPRGGGVGAGGAAETVGADREVERLALRALGWARSPARAADRRRVRALRAPRPRTPSYITDSPEPVAGQRLVWRGEIEPRARAAHAASWRSPTSAARLCRTPGCGCNLCELELRAGEWDAAARLLDEWAESADGRAADHADVPALPRAAGRRARRCRTRRERWATPALAERRAIGLPLETGSSRTRALGIAALLAHEPARAAERLRAVWDCTRARGGRRAGRVPGRPRAGRGARRSSASSTRPRAVADRLRELAEQQEHPWGLATAKRVQRGHPARVRDATTRTRPPRSREAADDYDALGLRFDARAVRCSASGRAQRRLQQVGRGARVARGAVAAFDGARLAGLGRAGALRARPRRRAPAARERRADADRAARGRAGRRGRAPTRRSRARSSSRCAPSRRTSRTPTRSSASARGPSSRGASSAPRPGPAIRRAWRPAPRGRARRACRRRASDASRRS